MALICGHRCLVRIFERILRSIGTKLTNLENIQNRMLYLTSRDVFCNQPEVYDFRFKSYGSNSGFNVFDDLDLDL